jgi:hypothetical protein
MQNGGARTIRSGTHPDMDDRASNTDKTTHAIMLQRRYTVTVNIRALSACHPF